MRFEPFKTYEVTLSAPPGDWRKARTPLIIMAVAILVAAGAILRIVGVLPYWVPLIGQDSGVAACEAIASSGGTKIDGGAGENATDAEKIRAVRALFADSRHDDIRQHGVAFMDLTTQIMAMGEKPDLSALALVGPITTAYAGLAGGCADQGHTIPPMMGAK